ncbi:T9SS type A sorting domain-containing protein [Flavobacterium caeni]|uniref:Por secretion system C-terminal sorting domain-containing protein n=1 Tax=Flavobacterium caeni TaxID=490189 RepID=A0A1G5KCM8_9FLAO|nr:T9SS type A sorting domain-containing protein [Flavobacterium caeni]SCY97808.1 Por secretion system C-terminal sorting domain-containing protein [Flavobacterium caeni]
MKKNLLILAIFAISKLNAQATLEHTYTSNGTSNEINQSASGFGLIRNFYTQNGVKYYTLNTNTNSIEIFNVNHQLQQQVNFPEEIGNILYITDHLFNNDDLIEILYTNLNDLVLINEQGTILQTFPLRSFAKIFKSDENTFKLCTSRVPFNEFNFDIYSLTGTLSLLQEQLYAQQNLIGFPNPASDKINITNPILNGSKEMIFIFDASGKKVHEQEFLGNGENIIINTVSLSSGVYTYIIKGKTNKFIKQ